MSQERRVHSRFVVQLAAEIIAGSRHFTATTRDISSGGCCIASPYGLEEGSAVQCALYVVVDGIEEADLPALETRATVQWAADTGEKGDTGRHVAGLKFVDLSQAQREWLEATIARAEASASE